MTYYISREIYCDFCENDNDQSFLATDHNYESKKELERACLDSGWEIKNGKHKCHECVERYSK